jgi:hypothetical protein
MLYLIVFVVAARTKHILRGQFQSVLIIYWLVANQKLKMPVHDTSDRFCGDLCQLVLW